MIGKTISHYRIIDKIGQGGMGVVYKAEDTRLQRTVALKFLPPHLLGDTPERARFLHEARAAAALSHPNICTIYEIDDAAEQPFIAMEYIEGKTLKEMTENGPLPIADAVRYATQVARGLEEAHAKGVVHRDIKSANIVVSAKGHAIVMDFGLAVLQGQTRLTRTGTTVGTVSYMSPEQARAEDVDHRGDLWSLGVVLYRMVTGRYPFEGDHASSVMYAIMNEPHTPLTALRTGVPLDLERIVDKALAKNPDERYQTASDMIVDLKAVRNQLEAHRPITRTAAAPKARFSQRGWVIAGVTAAVVVVVAAALGYLAWHHWAGPGGEPAAERVVPKNERVSIAVLPLENMSADKSQEYFADAMTEALIAELAQIGGLRVISRTSVMRFKDTTRPIPEIAATLGVNTVIEGSVVKAGDRVRVTAQLIDGKTDEHLWAHSYDRKLSNVLTLQADVARAIADEVKVKLSPRESAHLASARQIDPRAYDLYSRGRYHWNRRTRGDLKQALDLFQRAVDIQPDYAMAYVAMAQTRLVMGTWNPQPPRELFPPAQEEARKALALDPELGAAWAVLGSVAESYGWDWATADEDFRKAIDLEPNNATAHQWYGEFLELQGRCDEAVDELEKAKELDPLSLIVATVYGSIVARCGNLAAGMDALERVEAADSSFAPVHMNMALTCFLAHQDARAVDELATFYASFDSTGFPQRMRAAYAAGGLHGYFRAVIAHLHDLSHTQYVMPTQMAVLYARLGDADSMMVWFQKAYDEHDDLSGLARIPFLGPFRDDPRFQALLKRVKLDHVTPIYLKK